MDVYGRVSRHVFLGTLFSLDSVDSLALPCLAVLVVFDAMHDVG